MAAARALVNPPHSDFIARTLGDLVYRKNLSSRARIAALHAVTEMGSSGVQTWVRYSGLWFNGDRPEVWSECARMMAEVSHPRSRANFPAPSSGSGAEWTERLSLEPWATFREHDAALRLNAILGLHSPELLRLIIPVLGESDPFLVSAAIEALGQPGNSAMLLEHAGDEQPKIRIGVLLALRRTGDAQGREAIPQFLDDADPSIRRAAIQWVAEDRLQEFVPRLEEAASKPPVTRELFEALLAAKDILAGVKRNPTDEPSGEEFILKILADERQGASLRAMALRSLRPDHPALAVARLQQLLDSSDAELRLEAIRTLGARPDAASQHVLRGIAADAQAEPAIRNEAVLGLAHSASSDATSRLLVALINDSNELLRREAMRSLRDASVRQEVADAIRSWLKKSDGSASEDEREQAELLFRVGSSKEPAGRIALLEHFGAAASKPGDATAGQRVFFHRNGPQCFVCHRVNGRGGAAGPDLSVIGRTLDREKLIRSVLEPSKDIAPQFTPWLFTLHNGQVLSGIILREDPRGTLTLADADGKSIDVNLADIDQRKALDKSIMPENIYDRMTRSEFCDLITYLTELK
jgi:putative heme-binding domain-containing protein